MIILLGTACILIGMAAGIAVTALCAAAKRGDEIERYQESDEKNQ